MGQRQLINLDKNTYRQNNMDIQNYLVVKPELLNASAPQTDIGINVQLNESQTQIVEYDQTSNINLFDVFYNERQKSTIFRPIVKISYVYDNNIIGYCPNPSWSNYLNNLYYINPPQSIISGQWSGLPSYQEFEFIRTDINNTQLNNTNFQGFIVKSSSTYNWAVRLSYPFENLSNVEMSYNFKQVSINWIASAGIPFIISIGTDNGLQILQFNCPVKHNLLIGDYVELLSPISGQTFMYNSGNTYQVYSLGNNTYGSDEYIFNLYNLGYTGNTFFSGKTGTFKRIIDINNPQESKSRYYVKNHRILTNAQDTMITRSGYEENSYANGTVYQLSGATPNGKANIFTYQSSYAYNATFERDFNIENRLDNNGKPISEIFVSFQWCGYMGWHNQLQRGWQFNMTSGTTNSWFDTLNSNSFESNSLNYYVKNERTLQTLPSNSFQFKVNLPKNSGDTIYGDFCEYNDIEQLERVISPYMNKFSYNQALFTTDVSANQTNPNGFYYQVHFPIKIRVFSSYLETAPQPAINSVPNYAYFSENQNEWIWRDLYDYGFIDAQGVGLDIPFLNEAHYPYKNVIFKLYSDESSFVIPDFYQITIEPLTDPCE